MVKKVPSVMPPTITRPTYGRLSSPVPDAIADGNAPRIIVDEDITTGLKRRAKTSTAIRVAAMPDSTRLWAKSTPGGIPCLVIRPSPLPVPISL